MQYSKRSLETTIVMVDEEVGIHIECRCAKLCSHIETVRHRYTLHRTPLPSLRSIAGYS